jgi:hypothetical protein
MLHKLILILVLTSLGTLQPGQDIDGDQRLGLAEAIYPLGYLNAR